MFYRKGRTAGYLSVYHFKLEHFLFNHFVYFFKVKFKVLSYKVFSGRDMLNKYMFSNSKIIVRIIVISILTKIIQQP